VLDFLPALDEEPTPELDADAMARVAWIARTLAPSRERLGITVDLLGRAFDVVSQERRLLVVPIVEGREERSYARTAHLHVSYLDTPLEGDERVELDRAIETIREAERRSDARLVAPWTSSLRALAGESVLLDTYGITPTTPDRVRSLGAEARSA
jgi:hypothetical protein